MKNLFYFFFLVMFIGCGKPTDAELWTKVESAKKNNNWDSTTQVCKMILTEYPQSAYAPWAQFGLAESYRFKKQQREALDNYKAFYEHYPDMQPSALSLFLVGYIYNNDLKMIDSAKYVYEKFLQKYPHHDLAPSVKIELETLGQEPEEAMRNIERKQATAKQ
jgi:TolA-binding protein